MSFMKPYVESALYFEIETTCGLEIVPASAIGRTCSTAAEAFANYVEGNIQDEDELIEVKEGFLARMSAPGYMDCTDWTAHATEKEALAYLAEMYGDDTGDEEESED